MRVEPVNVVSFITVASLENGIVPQAVPFNMSQ